MMVESPDRIRDGDYLWMINEFQTGLIVQMGFVIRIHE